MRAWLGRTARAPETATVVGGDAGETFTREAMSQLLTGRRPIETSIPDAATSRRFLDRVIAQWQALGEADPYWSNDTQDRFRLANLTDASVAEFYDEGHGIIGFIDAFESRCEVDVGNGVCMELGCGVGKHTHALARRFARVIGIDVSGAGLEVCDRHMKQFGLTNVTTKRLTAPGELLACGAIHFFVCLSVLQHNPPPIQKQLLELALATLQPGGYALFQAPDYREGYSFSNERFLMAQQSDIDIHCLPKTEVLRTLDAAGMKLLDFAPDATLGNSLGSYTYFARKA